MMLRSGDIMSKVFRDSSFEYIFPENFNPIRLFQSGQEGALWQAYDQSTVFTTNTSTVLASVGNECGRLQDTSKGTTLGPELVVNGTFNTNVSGWTPAPDISLVWENGAARVSNTINTFGGITSDNFATVAGKSYLVSFNMIEQTGNGMVFVVQTSSGSNLLVLSNVVPGNYSFAFVATTSIAKLLFVNTNNSTSNRLLDNISVREIPGNHLIQSSATLRGILQEVSGNRVVRMDLVNDAYSVVLPVGVTGQILVAGIGGQKVTNVNVAADGTFSLGPTTWTGGSAGDLSAVHGSAATGGIVGAVLRQGAFTERETNELVKFMKNRGAGILL